MKTTRLAYIHMYVHTDVGVVVVPRGDLYKGDDYTIINDQITQKCAKNVCLNIRIERQTNTYCI